MGAGNPKTCAQDINMLLYMCTYEYVFIYALVYAHTHVNAQIYTFAHIHIRVFICACVYLFGYVCVCEYTNIIIHPRAGFRLKGKRKLPIPVKKGRGVP